MLAARAHGLNKKGEEQLNSSWCKCVASCRGGGGACRTSSSCCRNVATTMCTTRSSAMCTTLQSSLLGATPQLPPSSPLPPYPQNILVFDLGGGTFDVSILTIDSGVFEVRTPFCALCFARACCARCSHGTLVRLVWWDLGVGCHALLPHRPAASAAQLAQLCWTCCRAALDALAAVLTLLTLLRQVISTSGDTHLGGEDFDQRVME